VFNRITGGTVTCNLLIVGGDTNDRDRQTHTWTFGQSQQFTNSQQFISAMWTLAGAGASNNYPQGWKNTGTLMLPFNYIVPISNTGILRIGCGNPSSLYGTAIDNNNNNNVIAHVYPLNWPPELSEWSLNLSGPLKPSGPTFYTEFVGGRVITVPIKKGLFKSYGGTSKYGADQGTATVTGSWNWTINVQ
jgi:hypothetical protein